MLKKHFEFLRHLFFLILILFGIFSPFKYDILIIYILYRYYSINDIEKQKHTSSAS